MFLKLSGMPQIYSLTHETFWLTQSTCRIRLHKISVSSFSFRCGWSTPILHIEEALLEYVELSLLQYLSDIKVVICLLTETSPHYSVIEEALTLRWLDKEAVQMCESSDETFTIVLASVQRTSKSGTMMLMLLGSIGSRIV
jgi:hypothetical protein